MQRNPPRIRDFQTDDYPTVVAIGNAVWPDLKVTPQDLAARDRRLAGRTQRRRVAEADGEVVGFSVVESDWHDPDPQHFRVSGAVAPAWQGHGVGRALWDEAMAWLAPRATAVVAEVRAQHAPACHLLERSGFGAVMQWTVSRLELARFDVRPWARHLAAVAAAGVEIESFAALRARDPQALARLHALRWGIDADLPGVHPRVPESVEALGAYFERNPSALPEGWLVAHQGDRYLGLTTFWASAADPTCLHTGFTGVVPDARRRGIGVALKVAGVELARRRGCTIVDTDNEAGSTMEQLNRLLGFEPYATWRVYRRGSSLPTP